MRAKLPAERLRAIITKEVNTRRHTHVNIQKKPENAFQGSQFSLKTLSMTLKRSFVVFHVLLLGYTLICCFHKADFRDINTIAFSSWLN